jgi:DNA-binding CsgD family transcriptional regulator
MAKAPAFDRARKMWQRGKTIRQIALATDLSPGRVRRLLGLITHKGGKRHGHN